MWCISLGTRWPSQPTAEVRVSAELGRPFPALHRGTQPAPPSRSILTAPGAGGGCCGASACTEEKHRQHGRQEDKVPTEQTCPSLGPWGGKGH